MSEVRFPVVELRQYTLHPGMRDVLVGLFDREFVETQEATGMAVLGQFTDLDDADRFVWLRGFSDMDRRRVALANFYGGPVWKAHRVEANATMVDSDDVLLLRPVDAVSGFPVPPRPRPRVGAAELPSSVIVATVCYLRRTLDDGFLDFYRHRMLPVLSDGGAAPLACLTTEYAENTFPALPVRTGHNAFVWFTRFAGRTDFDSYLKHLANSDAWQDHVLPALSEELVSHPRHLRLAPTARSLLS